MAQQGEKMTALAGEVQNMVERVDASLAAQPRALEEIRVGVASSLTRVAGDMDNLAKSISGLNSAMTSTSNSLEMQASKMSGLLHKASHCGNELAAMKGFLWGAAATASPDETNALLLELVQPTGGGAAPADSSSADESAVHELDRRLSSLQRQCDHNSEGVRTVTNNTYKRVDEHASAIQRLTLAVGSNMEDRPTSSAVKHMIEAQVTESAERTAASVLPMWDAVKVIQGSMRDMQADTKDLGAALAGLHQQQRWLEGRQASKQLKAQVEVHSQTPILPASLLQLQDRQSVLSASIEDQLQDWQSVLSASIEDQDPSLTVHPTTPLLSSSISPSLTFKIDQSVLSASIEDQVNSQLASIQSAAASMRKELSNEMCTAVHVLTERLDTLDLVTRQHQHDLEGVRDALGERVTAEDARSMVEMGSQAMARAELSKYKEKEDARWQGAGLSKYKEKEDARWQGAGLSKYKEKEDARWQGAGLSKYKEKEDARWQVWMEKFSDALDRYIQRGEVEELLLTATQQMVRDASSAMEPQVQESVTKQLKDKAEQSSVETALKQLAKELERKVNRPELESELSRKLDVRTYLASSSANAAAAAVAGITSHTSPPRGGRTQAGLGAASYGGSPSMLPSYADAAAGGSRSNSNSNSRSQRDQQLEGSGLRDSQAGGLGGFSSLTLRQGGARTPTKGVVRAGDGKGGVGLSAASAAVSRLNERRRRRQQQQQQLMLPYFQ
eukprot:gene16295-22483_t